MKTKNIKNYKFRKGEIEIEIEAANYTEALTGLVCKVGSESDAAEFIFVGVN